MSVCSSRAESTLSCSEVHQQIECSCREWWERRGRPAWLDLREFVNEVWLRLLEQEARGLHLDIKNPGWRKFVHTRAGWTVDDLGREHKQHCENEVSTEAHYRLRREKDEGDEEGEQADNRVPDDDDSTDPEMALLRSESLGEISEVIAHTNLSPREMKAVELISQGYTPKEIAVEFGVNVSTVYGYTSRAREKLEVTKGDWRD